MKLSFIAAAFTAVAALAPLTKAERYQDAAGQVDIAKAPSTIVTFDLAPLDTLDALGVPVAGVTKGFAVNYLAKYQADRYQSVGSLFEPDFEMTAALEPDLIIVGPRSAKQRPMLNEIATTFDSSVWGDDFLNQFYQMTETLAAIVGKENEAAKQLADIKTKISTLQTVTAKQGKGLFIIVTGGKIMAFGPGSRYDWVYSDLGVPAAIGATNNSNHGEPISFEYLQQMNPDWLFVLDRDAAIGKTMGAAQALLDNDLVNNISAAKKDQILYLDGYSWYMVGYGLTAMNNAISQLHDAYTR